MKQFSLLICFMLISMGVFAQGADPHAPERSFARASLAPFYHGVASGDPLQDRVIIWTRVTTTDPTESVKWRVATDTGMVNAIDSGIVVTDATKDYTVKVDVMNLQPNTFYYYEFEADGMLSVRGRTKTAPKGDVDSLRFAVVSCSNYAGGYFNAYNRITARNDLSAVIHLGDYYYEYGTGGLGNARSIQPTTEITTLSDYRMRHSHYKLDQDLMRVHQQYPFICVWDDHETANNSYTDGAENHTPGTEGNWIDRKGWAVQAYFEWMPLRMPDPAVDTQRIYRRFRFGDLLELHMLDTRLQERDEPDFANATDPNHTILGNAQMDWLTTGMDTSTAQWQIVGQQVMMATLDANILPFGNPIYVNNDQWDGYRAERQKLYDSLSTNNIDNMVVLTGDIHTAWANNLEDGNNKAGVEFVVNSVTTQSSPLPIGVGLIQTANPHMKYIDLTNHGYYILDVNKTRTQADFYFVGTISNPSTVENWETSWYTNNNANELSQSIAASIAHPHQIGVPAPLDPRFCPILPVEMTQDITESVLLGVYPNPFKEELSIQYTLDEPTNIQLMVSDMVGRKLLAKDMGEVTPGLQRSIVDLSSLAAGTYVVTLHMDDKMQHRVVVKQ
ncbi:MAG: T9SS type A sorting domain-containing protein [Aureispira sp.]|nr:T9SS type A sorting domain-containing protein [Aureispira sp.]